MGDGRCWEFQPTKRRSAPFKSDRLLPWGRSCTSPLLLVSMIPTLLLVGFIAGFLPRGWLALPAALIGWPTLLVTTGIDSGFAFVVAAGLVGGANAAVGLLAGLGVQAITRRHPSKID